MYVDGTDDERKGIKRILFFEPYLLMRVLLAVKKSRFESDDKLFTNYSIRRRGNEVLRITKHCVKSREFSRKTQQHAGGLRLIEGEKDRAK